MKFILTYVLSIVFTTCLIAQHDLEIVKIKNSDRSVLLSAANHSDVNYSVVISLELEGMELEKPLLSKIMVPAHTTVEVGKLLAKESKTRYKVRFQATPVDEESSVIEVISPNVILYSKNGHKKSTQVRIYLGENNIDYREHNITYDKESKKRYRAMLERRSLKPSEVKLPLLIIDGEVYYNINNISSFLKEKFE